MKNKYNLPKSKKPEKTSNWINYEDSIVIFLDILGFQDLIHKSHSQKDHLTNKEVIANLYDGIQTIRTILKIDSLKEDENKYFVASFSDCVIITFPYSEPNALFETLFQLQLLLVNLNHRKILVRGGITKGLIYADKYFQIVFGPGLVEAYLLESKAAHYPRVILAREIINICKENSIGYIEDEIEGYLKNILTQDCDGMYYIDYFKPLEGDFDSIHYDYSGQLLKIRKLISKGLLIRNPGINVKYLWMKEKFNGILKRIQEEKYLSVLSSKGEIDLAKNIKKLKPFS